MADAPRSNGNSQPYREFTYCGPSRAQGDTAAGPYAFGDGEIAEVTAETYKLEGRVRFSNMDQNRHSGRPPYQRVGHSRELEIRRAALKDRLDYAIIFAAGIVTLLIFIKMWGG